MLVRFEERCVMHQRTPATRSLRALRPAAFLTDRADDDMALRILGPGRRRVADALDGGEGGDRRRCQRRLRFLGQVPMGPWPILGR
jgi:hypothetical protein